MLSCAALARQCERAPYEKLVESGESDAYARYNALLRDRHLRSRRGGRFLQPGRRVLLREVQGQAGQQDLPLTGGWACPATGFRAASLRCGGAAIGPRWRVAVGGQSNTNRADKL